MWRGTITQRLHNAQFHLFLVLLFSLKNKIKWKMVCLPKLSTTIYLFFRAPAAPCSPWVAAAPPSPLWWRVPLHKRRPQFHLVVQRGRGRGAGNLYLNIVWETVFVQGNGKLFLKEDGVPKKVISFVKKCYVN